VNSLLLEKVRYANSDGTVLRTYRTGEGDLFVDILLKGPGILRVLAKNALKSHRRFGGCLTVPSRIQASFAKRSHTWYLEEAALLDPFLDLKSEPRTYAMMGYAVECLITTGQSQEHPGELETFFAETVNLLRRPPNDLVIKKIIFDLNLLALNGVEPLVDACVHCEEESPSSRLVGYDIVAGGVVCEPHYGLSPRCVRTTVGTLKALAHLSGTPLVYPRTVVLGKRQRNQAVKLTGLLIEEHLGFRPRALTVLRQVFHATKTLS